ncbi:MAG: energy transducer TonB [Pseudomonadota bacterium]
MRIFLFLLLGLVANAAYAEETFKRRLFGPAPDIYDDGDLRLIVGGYRGRNFLSIINFGGQPQNASVYFAEKFEDWDDPQKSSFLSFRLNPYSATEVIYLRDIEGAYDSVVAWRAGESISANVEVVEGINNLELVQVGPDRDAQPFYRVPPRYPERCMKKASPRETVYVEFDVDARGDVQNLVVFGSTNECLNDAALKSVSRWVYMPKFIDGVFATRVGVQTMITFKLVD